MIADGRDAVRIEHDLLGDREIPGGGFGWTTLTDPAGNEFCVSGGH